MKRSSESNYDQLLRKKAKMSKEMKVLERDIEKNRPVTPPIKGPSTQDEWLEHFYERIHYESPLWSTMDALKEIDKKLERSTLERLFQRVQEEEEDNSVWIGSDDYDQLDQYLANEVDEETFRFVYEGKCSELIMSFFCGAKGGGYRSRLRHLKLQTQTVLASLSDPQQKKEVEKVIASWQEVIEDIENGEFGEFG